MMGHGVRMGDSGEGNSADTAYIVHVLKPVKLS